MWLGSEFWRVEERVVVAGPCGFSGTFISLSTSASFRWKARGEGMVGMVNTQM